MQFFLISDNLDTQVGMRMAGIDGVVVHGPEETRSALLNAIERTDCGIILMTDKLVRQCSELVDDLKLNRSRPLIVEIPDRHGGGRARDSITRYVHDAIGINLKPSDRKPAKEG